MGCDPPAIGRGCSARNSNRSMRFIGAQGQRPNAWSKRPPWSGKRKAMQYSWIRGQAILEQENCRAQLGDSGLAHRDMARALALVRSARLPGSRITLSRHSRRRTDGCWEPAGRLEPRPGRASRNTGVDLFRESALSRSTLIWCAQLRAWGFPRRHTYLRGQRPGRSVRHRVVAWRP